ncbi:hypothetical protein P9112_005765 [Eukaryota sp. TZLM1-RC]
MSRQSDCETYGMNETSYQLDSQSQYFQKQSLKTCSKKLLNFYGLQSTLVYEEFNLISSSGVKQVDPLGPFFFCLAIHPLMCELTQEFPDVHITAYMDDISIIGPIDSLRTFAEIVQQRYYQIGLSLNISKCLLINREPADLIIDDQSVPFINYFESGFRFLGCYLGNFDEI